jgi:hypothetical protein
LGFYAEEKMKPFTYNGETLGGQRTLRPDLRCHLSLLGLGGGGGLGLSGSATASGPTLNSGGTITVNNGSNGPLSSQTWLIIAGVGLLALLILEIFHGRK